MLHRRLSLQPAILLALLLPLILTLNEISQSQSSTPICQCINGGTCSQNDKYIACSCPQGFVGTKCQTQAAQLSESQQEITISQEYAYFYFQPSQINYYQISLKICLPPGDNKKLTNLVFLEVQRSSGKLKLQPSIYQTSPLTFDGNSQNCQTFYTHFIPIRKKLNQDFQKVVFGVAIKNNSDPQANRWVNFLERTLNGQKGVKDEPLKANQLFGAMDDNENDQLPIGGTNQAISQIYTQKITISCSYQLYLAQNYWGTAIIIMSALTLFISTAVFLYTIRNKYTYTLSNQDILRLYALNPEDFASNQPPPKNDLTHFQLIMPIMTYQLFLQKQKRSKRKHPRNLLKRRMEMHRQRHCQQQKQKIIKQDQQKGDGDKCQDVSKQHINQIPKNQFYDVFSETSSVGKSQDSVISVENVCTICLINFELQQKIRHTPCRHVFHSDCIDNWCQNTLNCPICRNNLQIPNFMRKRQFRALIDN